jgi:hypothetical protein
MKDSVRAAFLCGCIVSGISFGVGTAAAQNSDGAKAISRAYFACMMEGIRRLDDRITPAQVVASAVNSRCTKQMDAFARDALRESGSGLGPVASEGFIESFLKRTREFTVEMVLEERAKARRR